MKKNKKLTATFSSILMMISAFTLMLNVPVKAQYTNMQEGGSIPLPAGVTPDETYESIAHINFRPNPIGSGQPLLVNIWMQPPIHISRYFKDAYEVTLTDPEGNDIVITKDSYRGDTTAWFEYTINEVGTWQIKFDFLGGYFPPGNYTRIRISGDYTIETVYSFPNSVYYEPSSDGPYEFEVLDELTLSWPPSPLPTDYWTRPISPENREWKVIAGNWPWPYANIYDYAGPYTIAPNTAHVVWRRQGDIAGLVGGDLGQLSFFVNPFNPAIIYDGRAYQTIAKPGTGTSVKIFWQCYDIRTGEPIWEYEIPGGAMELYHGRWRISGTSTPTQICYDPGGYQYVPGEEATHRFMEVTLMNIGSRLIKYNPWDGRVMLNVTGMPGTLYGTNVLSVQNLGGGNRRLINWTTIDSLIPDPTNFTQRVISNVTWPFSSLGTVDFEAGVAVQTQSITPVGAGVSYGQRIMAASLETGQVLWNITTDVNKGVEGFFSGSTKIADHGKFAVRFNDGHWHCWNLQTGAELWVSELSSWPWGIFGVYGSTSAYGLIISCQYDGVAAYDWNTGKLAWFYEYIAPYPYETVFGDSYAFYQAVVTVADGKVFTSNAEHSPSQPIVRGMKLHCVNATTGEGIWNITGAMTPGAVADGYFTSSNWYDGYMYVFGKGKSETTVEAPLTAVPLGTAMTITGSVLDMSPAQPGTPCVSKDSMTTQMEYLHMQHPIDGVGHDEMITGVPVTLTAIDSDGFGYNLGTVTTSGYHGTFGKAWTPTKQDTYEIVASFEGDDSYGSSGASTFITVGPAPSAAEPETEPPTTEEPTTAEPTTEPPTTEPTTEQPTTAEPTTEQPSGEAPFPTTEVIIIAAIAVAAVIGIGAYWALRKSK
jgi:outer membrane protein assembly factor BamB